MGLPVTVYRSSDAGAPLTRILKPSDWITVLKACLVDGYGINAGAGWTLDFEDVAGLKAVFRNSVADGGSGGAFQVQPHTTDSNDSYVRFTPARSISAIDTYFNKGVYRALKVYNLDFYSSGWMVIATSRGAWLINEPGTGGGGTTNNQNNLGYTVWTWAVFIGDIYSFIPNDMGVFTVASTSLNVTADYVHSGGGSTLGNGTYAPGCALYAADGSSEYTGYSTSYTMIAENASVASSADPIDIGVPIDLSPTLLIGTNEDSVTSARCRGILPGIFKTNFLAFRGQSTPIIKTFDGINYRLITGKVAGELFIQMSGNWYE